MRRTDTAWMLVAGAGLATGLVVGGAPSTALAQGDPLAEPFPPVFDLGELLPDQGGDGSIGLSMIGSIESQRAGWVATSAGDLNGDGINDVLIGSRQGDVPGGLEEQGVAYVVFGRRGGTAPLASLDLGSLNGDDGFAMLVDQDRIAVGYDAAPAGDLNGDGVDDIIVTARGSSSACGYGYLRGRVFVVFGRDSGAGQAFPAELDLLSVDGTNGFYVPGTLDCNTFGRSVAGVGDINGDDIDDIAFLSHFTEGVYVLFGRSQPAGDVFPARVPLSSIRAGRGFRVSPGSIINVAAAGDVNGDGFDDLALGAPGYDAVRYCYTMYDCVNFGRGRVFVLFGRDGAAQPFPDVVNADAVDGSDGFMLSTRKFDARLGSSMAGPGDLNGDGIDDLASGSPEYAQYGLPSDDYGEFHIVYGRAGPGTFERVIDLDTIGGDDGARFVGTGDACGSTLAAIGDINGDGRRDLAFSCPGRWRYAIDGRVSVVFGQASTGSIPPEFGLGDIIAYLGFTITPARSRGRLGDGLGGPVDFNGDGVDDLIVASPSASLDGRSLAGEAYVIYGRSVCPADLDRDGALTIFDFLAFGNLFDLMDPIADFDGDGDFTIFDFLAFQNAFDAGCP